MKRRAFLEACAATSALLPAVSVAGLSCGVQFFPGFGPRQVCTAGLLSPVAALFAQYQRASEWCWAASISMIFRYFGHEVDQSRIVKQTWGEITNQPGSVDQILSDLSRSWTDDDGNSFAASCDAYDANPVTAAQDLANDMPLLVCSLGHAMVLTGLTYVSDPTSPIGATVTAAIVRDPWPGNGGRRVLSPQEWYNISLLARVRIT
jgi:papain like cysteine protease AvrRpt2